jgi:hypothetical protein
MVAFDWKRLLGLPVYIEWCKERLFSLLKERRNREFSSRVEYRRLFHHPKLACISTISISIPLSPSGWNPRSTYRTGRIGAKPGIDFLEDIFDTVRRADVRRNTYRIATTVVDLLFQARVAARAARQEYHRVCFGELLRDCRTCSGSDARDDGVCL